MRIWRNVREEELTVADPLYVTGGDLVLTEEFVVRTMTLKTLWSLLRAITRGSG